MEFHHERLTQHDALTLLGMDEPFITPGQQFRVSVPAGKAPRRVLLSLDGKNPYLCPVCKSAEWDLTYEGETVTFTCDHDQENRHDCE